MEMEKDVIKLTVNLTPEDLYSFQKHTLKNAFKPIIVIVVVIGYLMLLLNIAASQTVLAAKVLSLLLAFTLPVIFIISLFRSLKKSADKAFKNNKLVQRTQRFTISEECIQIESDAGYSKIMWTDLYKAEEIKDSFLLYISKQQAFVISKRYFEADISLEELMRKFILQAPMQKKEKKFAISVFKGLLIYFGIFVVVLVAILYFGS